LDARGGSNVVPGIGCPEPAGRGLPFDAGAPLLDGPGSSYQEKGAGMQGSPKFLAAAALFFALPLAATAEIVYDGAILGRPKKYDYAPAHLFVEGVHTIWWCTASSSGDEIWMATKPGKLGAGGWTPAGKVFGRRRSPLTFQHTCDPSVLKGDFSFGGEPYGYAMYYTSARQSGGVNNAIGVAFSTDLVEWTANPEPVQIGRAHV
jgi:hypothetical protein